MNRGTILALVVLAGYIGFELHVLQRSKHRTEPLFIFEQYATADRAATRCGPPDADERRRFLANFAVVRRRAADDLAADDANRTPAAVEALLDERAAARAAAVDAVVEAGGCGDRQAWEWRKLHELRARLTLR